MDNSARAIDCSTIGLNSTSPSIFDRYQGDVHCFEIDGHRFTAVKTRSNALANTTDIDKNTRDNRAAIGWIDADDNQYAVFVDVQDDEQILPTAADCLTSRELQVATLIAEGKCDKEIARQLGISSYTVREHLRRIFSKLGVCRRSAVVSRILRRHR